MAFGIWATATSLLNGRIMMLDPGVGGLEISMQSFKEDHISDRSLCSGVRSYRKGGGLPMRWLVWNPTPEWIKLKGEASRGSLQPRAFLKRLPGELSETLCRLPSDALLGISLFFFGVAFKGPVCLGTTWFAFRCVGSSAACVSDSIWTDWLWMGW